MLFTVILGISFLPLSASSQSSPDQLRAHSKKDRRNEIMQTIVSRSKMWNEMIEVTMDDSNGLVMMQRHPTMLIQNRKSMQGMLKKNLN